MKAGFGAAAVCGLAFRRATWIAHTALWCALATAACVATQRSPSGGEVDCAECDSHAGAGGGGRGNELDSSAGGSGGENADAAGEADAPPQDAATWCQVRVVFEQKCQRCHSDPPANGAPFPLLTYDDTQVIDRSGVRRSERMAEAIESGYMPPRFIELDPPVEALTAGEKELLLEWLFAGAQATGTAQCAD